MGNQQAGGKVTTAYYHTDPNYQPTLQNQSYSQTDTQQPYSQNSNNQQQSSRQQNQVTSGSDSRQLQISQEEGSDSLTESQEMQPQNQTRSPTESGSRQPPPGQQQTPTYQGQPYGAPHPPPPYQGIPYGAAQQPYGPVPPAAFGKVIFVHSNQGNVYRSGRNEDIPPSVGIEEEQSNINNRWDAFSNKKIRRTFIRKVYFILTLQLLFTLGMICLFVFEPNVKSFVRENPVVYYVSLAVFAVVFLSLICSVTLRRKFPLNLIMLFIFTLAMSILLGTISSFYNTEVVMIAVGICAVVCLAVTLFSFHTKFDMTNCGGLLCILLLIVILFGLVAIFTRSKLVAMIYAGLGAVIFMMYLAYDTQMIMGGKHLEISPEEYILAALMLYIDIVYIYMFILMLLGYSN